jgi:hypothetical protein
MKTNRRRRRGGATDNLDSLLDTMANAVGILIVLLAVTQISVSDAVARLRSELESRPELSQESFHAAELEARELREALAPLLPTAGEKETLRREGRSELSGLRARVASLEAELAKIRDTPRGEAELTRSLAVSQAKARQLEQAITAEKRAALLASRELEALPTRAATRDLRLPDPRRPPRGGAQVIYFSRHGRIFRVDGGEMLKLLWDGVHRATGGTSRERLRGSSSDRDRVVQHFRRADIGSPSLRWHVLEAGGELMAQLEWRRTDLGETSAQITSALSRFRGDLLRYSPQGVYFHFFVWDDSFEVYTAARELSDRAGFSAGWTPFDAPRPFRQSLTQLDRNTLID